MEQFVYLTAEDQTHFAFAIDESKSIFFETTNQRLNRLFVNYERAFLLQGSGFNMVNQIDQWVNEFNPYDPETKVRSINKIMSDVTGFYHEFLSRRDIFPFDLKFAKDESKKKIVFASKYEQPLENITDVNERDGKLLEGIKIAVQLMVNAEPNTVIFLTSPDGWSGLPAGEHPDSQTYVYWINRNGDLHAMTLRTNISLPDSEKLIGINYPKRTKIDRIKDVVSKPILMKVVDDGFLEVLDKIESASDQKFEKIRNELKNRDKYIALTSEEDTEVKVILDELRLFIDKNILDNDDESIKDLALAIGKSILDMQAAVNKRVKGYRDKTLVMGYDSDEIKYQLLYQEVKQILGCSNGIKEQRGFGFDSKGPLDFACHKCNGINTRPYEGYCTRCKHCGTSFDKCGAN